MMPYLTTDFANANSTHQFGVGAYEAVKIARKQIAELINAETNEIIFTSGATESINLAIKGVAEGYKNRGNHIVTVSTEHNAVLDTCRFLETKGFEVTYLPVQSDGMLDIETLKSSLKAAWAIVSNEEITVFYLVKKNSPEKADSAKVGKQLGLFRFA